MNIKSMNTRKMFAGGLVAVTIVALCGTAIGMGALTRGNGGNGQADQPEKAFTIAFSDAPRSVRDTFKKLTNGAKPTKVERIVDEDVTKYEIEYDRHGDTASATMSDKGAVLEMEAPTAIKHLPAAVRTEVLKDYPGATIKVAEAVQLFYYEMDVVVDGKTIEVVAQATGDIEDWFSNKGENGASDNADGEND